MANTDVYTGENGEEWTRDELRVMFDNKSPPYKRLNLVAFGIAMMLRDDRHPREVTEQMVLKWGEDLAEKKGAFRRKTLNGVRKVYGNRSAHKFTPAQ